MHHDSSRRRPMCGWENYIFSIPRKPAKRSPANSSQTGRSGTGEALERTREGRTYFACTERAIDEEARPKRKGYRDPGLPVGGRGGKPAAA